MLAMVYSSFRSLSPIGLLIDDVEIEPDRIVITVRCGAAAGTCPDCGRQSGQVHSRYERRFLDLPSQVASFRCASRFADFDPSSPVAHAAFLPNRIGNAVAGRSSTR
jgi:hypothetical protein